jgi:hypothetical protein
VEIHFTMWKRHLFFKKQEYLMKPLSMPEGVFMF